MHNVQAATCITIIREVIALFTVALGKGLQHFGVLLGELWQFGIELHHIWKDIFVNVAIGVFIIGVPTMIWHYGFAVVGAIAALLVICYICGFIVLQNMPRNINSPQGKRA